MPATMDRGWARRYRLTDGAACRLLSPARGFHEAYAQIDLDEIVDADVPRQRWEKRLPPGGNSQTFRYLAQQGILAGALLLLAIHASSRIAALASMRGNTAAVSRTFCPPGKCPKCSSADSQVLDPGFESELLPDLPYGIGEHGIDQRDRCGALRQRNTACGRADSGASGLVDLASTQGCVRRCTCPPVEIICQTLSRARENSKRS